MTAKKPATKSRTTAMDRSATTVRQQARPRLLSERAALSDQGIKRRLCSGPSLLQVSLRIGERTDHYEREADTVAERVLRASASPTYPVIGTGAERHPGVQAKGDVGRSAPTPEVGARLRSLGGRGRPLPAETRAFFEPRFGYDFSQVRIHDSAPAAAAARGLQAKAFTVGRDIVFGQGQFAPRNHNGRRMLAHELTHVIQQQQSANATGHQPWVQRTPTQAVSPEFHFGEFSGHDDATDEELERQLAEGDVSFFAIYQDDKAREIVRRWLDPDYSRFTQLNTDQRTLLIRQMLSGATLNDDERAILELLSQQPEQADIPRVIATVGRTTLLGDLHGAEDRALRELLGRLESGASEAEIEQCRLGTGEVTPQCDPGLTADRFQLSESGIGHAIFAGLNAAAIPNPFSCDLQQAVIALLPGSPTFLRLAHGIERRYFCGGGSGITFHFHADPSIGSHFRADEAAIQVEVTDQSREDDRIELIRTLVHEIVHASHTQGARGPNIAARVESQIVEEALTRKTENAIMRELLGGGAWTTLVGRRIAEADLEQSETDPSIVRRDFISGFPKLTYVEHFIIRDRLAEARGSQAGINERRMSALAHSLMGLGLVPAAVTERERQSFDFQLARTRSALTRRLQRHTSPRPPERPAPPRRVDMDCIEPYYLTGRSPSIPASVSSNCRAFLERFGGEINSPRFRTLFGERHARTREAYDRRIYALLAEMRSDYLAPEAWDERDAEIVRLNRPIQAIIDAATGSSRLYFEWILIREAMSREWRNTPGTSGTATPDQEAAIEAIRNAHLAFLRRRIPGSLRHYRYQTGLPQRRRGRGARRRRR